MNFLELFNFILHIDSYLESITSTYGFLTYLILFGIVFLETGVVITPFLPGDSLLFAAGAIASLGTLNVFLLATLLFIAAFLGDSLNYWIGRNYGRVVVEWANKRNFLIKKEHIEKTEDFYDKYGGKAIILARFIPIIRTFAPFVAGIGKMDYRRFMSYNISGGFLWVFLFVFAGFFFGNIPIIKDNFSIVILIIIIASIIPILVELIRRKN